MTSTYSPNLAIQLPATGDQSGQWGNTTNTNLGTLIESAISGVVTQTFADANLILPMPLGADGGSGSAASPVAARNMFIQCVGTNTAPRTLTLPANKKIYIIYNNTTGGYALTIACTNNGTSVNLPNGSAALLVCDGTNIYAPLNYFAALDLSTTSATFASAPLQITTVASGYVAGFTDGTNTEGAIAFDGSNHNLQVGSFAGNYGVELVAANRVALTASSTGQVTIPYPPTSVAAFTSNGPPNSWAGVFNGYGSANQSTGVLIQAGTGGTTEQAFTIVNYNDTLTFLRVTGTGSLLIGNPTGGDQGIGSINTQTLYINGSPIYSGAPVNIPNVNYDTVASDNGKILLRTTSTVVTYTIEDTLYSVGALITFTNIGANSLLIGNTATLVWSPSGSVGSRTLAQFGTATAQKLTSGYWLISGSGIS